MVKRPASSTAGSPPPATSQPKPKKPRASKPKAPKKSKKDQSLSTPAGSPGASSPPPTAGSPPRGRSMNVVAGNEAEPNVKEKKKGKKGKEKAKDQDRDGEEEDGDGQQQQGEEGDQDAEDEVLVFSDDEFGSNAKEIAQQKEDLRVLLEHFDEEQMSRYEHYRRSGLNKSSVRKLVNQVLGQSVSPSILTVVRGFAKVFVGEIVEKARANSPHPGPLTPSDLRDAYRVYLEEHEGPGAGGMGGGKKKMFVR
ncbi:hypothetical protein JCM5353_008798 [Sporobolomyces roseus]